WDRDVSAGLLLLQLQRPAVIGRPRQAQQVALALAGIDGEHHRQAKVRRRAAQERGNPFIGPNLVDSRAAIELAASRTRILGDWAAIGRPSENARQGFVSVVGLPQ